MLMTRLVKRESIERKINTMKDYFRAYGGKTLFLGRFIPFGVRNIIFMTCGLIKLPLSRFMIIDLCAVICTSTILFTLGYSFGNNYELIFPYLNKYKFIIAILLAAILLIAIIKKKYTDKRNSPIQK